MELGIFVAPQQGATYDDQVAVARAAEQAGFGLLLRSDHLLDNADVAPPPGPTDAWTTLAGLARDTETIRLGTLVSPVTFRLPGLLAVIVSQVDVMSGGRVVLGLGAGWHAREHEAYGIPFPGMDERFGRLEEQLAVVRGMWTTPADERFDFTGRYYTLRSVPALPRPVQQPHPPIVVGGSGRRRTPRLAARFADEFNVPPMHTPDEASALYGLVREACRREGRSEADIATSVTLTTICGTDDREVERRGERSPGDRRIADVIGTPPVVAARLQAYAEAGAQRIYLRIPDLHDLDHVALLGEAVLPALR